MDTLWERYLRHCSFSDIVSLTFECLHGERQSEYVELCNFTTGVGGE